MTQVKELSAQGIPVSITPLVGRTMLDAFCAYEFPVESLNISSYLSLDAVSEGMEFDGVRVATLQGGELQRFNMTHHIVLPVPGAESIVAHMLENGVEPDRITALELDMNAALEKRRQVAIAAE